MDRNVSKKILQDLVEWWDGPPDRPLGTLLERAKDYLAAQAVTACVREIVVEDITNERIMRTACDMTRKPGMKPSTISRAKLLQCGHSPVRLIRFWIEMRGLFTFVSVHLVRHFMGVLHFVESNRDDRGGADAEEVNRLTPVNHGIEVNAQALMTISESRLCYNSHRSTVAAWIKVKKAVTKVCPDTGAHMVPRCVALGYCPELRECGPGVKAVLRAYQDAPQAVLRREQSQ